MRPEKDTILIIEDVKSNADILLSFLVEDYEVSVAMDGLSGLDLARRIKPDLILLDVVLPDIDGFEVCSGLKGDSGTVDIPVIFVTCLSQEMNESHGLKLGAIDYIAKPFSPDLVKSRIKNHLELVRYRRNLESLVDERTRELKAAKAELEKTNKKLEITSRTDRLTGLANRYGVDAFLKRQIYRSKRGHPFSMAIGDIDHFKTVNDDYGHSKGDDVLVSLSEIFQTTTREVDLVGRWGGEEFIIIYEDMNDDKDLFYVTDRIRKKVETYDFGIGRPVTISFGVATFFSGEKVDDLIYRADEALYEAKKTGRNMVVLAGHYDKTDLN